MQKYAKYLNNRKREELGWRSAFEVYFGRKSNDLVPCGKSIEKDREPVVLTCLHPSSDIISENERKIARAREVVQKRNEEVSNRNCKIFQTTK